MVTQPASLATIEAALLPAVETYTYPETPGHPEAAQLLAYWQECMAGGGFVMGRDIPNRRIGALLRSIIVHEPMLDGSDLMVRLAGSAVRRRFDREIKGERLSQLFPPDVFQRHLKSALDAMLRWKPVILEARLMRGEIEQLHSTVLLLPIRAQDRISTWLLAGLFFHN